MKVVELSSEEYMQVFLRTTDRHARHQLKVMAFAILYSHNPEARVLIPEALMPDLRSSP